MQDREPDEAMTLASYSLGQLLQKESSVEAGVRAVLRVATMRKHALWQAWAYLQLSNIYEPFRPQDFEETHELISEAFPDADKRNEILEKAFADYKKTRVDDANPLVYHLADIGDFERDLPIYEADLMRKISLARFAQRDLRRNILNRVKNRVQIYLMAVEARTAIPRLGD